MEKISLANYISTTREKVGLSQTGLANRTHLPLEVIESIEAGKDLFLSTSIRQKIATALKIEAKNIKAYEKEFVDNDISAEYIEKVKISILMGRTDDLECPVCKSELVCKVFEMYDMKDNLIRHPKARCVKCPFQIK